MKIKEIFADWTQKQLTKKVANGGKLVGDAQAKARKAVCATCPKAGKVKVPVGMFTIEADGCTECGCPFATKPHIDIIMRDASTEENAPLTAGELIKTATGLADKRPEKVICPHPDGNKWQPIDNIFQK